MDNSTLHPWQKDIMAMATQSEALGQLNPKVLDIAYKQQWFKLFVPKIYGGAGLTLPQILRLEEALAYADGSTAWTVTLCSGAAWFAGFLDAEFAKEIFADDKVCFAGSGAVGGTAQKTAIGYTVNGHWKYASGALHATIFTANCTILAEDGAEVKGLNGNPLVKSFILKKEEVNILSGWAYVGLVATGSHAFEVKDLKIPFNREFEINGNVTVHDEGFNYPFMQMAETTLAVNSLGMASRFLDLAGDSFAKRTGISRYTDAQLIHFQQVYRNAEETLKKVKEDFYTAFDSSWNELKQLDKVSQATADNVSKQSRLLAHTARRVVDELFPYAGLEAAKKDSTLNRVWRDLHTASQHSLLTFIDI